MSLQDINLETEYRTGEYDPVECFYKPCLQNSISYDRASGYFKSTVFSLATHELCGFALRGGKIRIICSPQISTEDIQALIQNSNEFIEKISCEYLEAEINSLIEETALKSSLSILSTFLKFNIIEIKVAVPSHGNGIFHEKLGIFYDGKNRVSFKGSINETFNGWHSLGNFESIDAYCDWEDTSDRNRVIAHSNYFEKLWSGNVNGVLVFDIPSALANNLLEYSLSDLKLVRGLIKESTNKDLPKKKAQLTRTPFEHQSSAIASWKANKNRGILKHATGSGKTFTAILILKEFLADGLPTLVLVPSKLLQKQWYEELKQEFPDAAILLVGGFGKGSQIRSQIASMTDPRSSLGQRIIVAIMNTATSDWFLNSIKQSQNLLVVADEVHRLGSNQFSRFFVIDAGSRLGLSATPERFGDPDGTQKLFNYFDGIVPPEYTLADAINDKRLVKYEYYPIPVNLTAEEADLWKVETKKIRKAFARSKRDNDGNIKVSKSLQLQIINRSRIAKKASKKIELCLDVISNNYKKGQRWLIYCEDQYQLKEIMDMLFSNGYSPLEYHSAMSSNKDASLKWFVDFGGILVSIKCLDEGIDIPTISHALILASSQNPRQFIQRRGRVLRKVEGKNIAYIYDAIVVPVCIDDEPEQVALLEAELLRAIEFSKTAINSHSSSLLRQIAIDNDLDFSSLFECGIEIEEGE